MCLDLEKLQLLTKQPDDNDQRATNQELSIDKNNRREEKKGRKDRKQYQTK